MAPQSLFWRFKLITATDRVQWAWERLEQGRIVASSIGFLGTLSHAFSDAKEHGFNDAHDKYKIIEGVLTPPSKPARRLRALHFR
jgi:hypothetical protein